MGSKKNSYNLSADVIRALAIFGVVIIHTANAVYGRPDFFDGISWWFAIILNSVSRASIPLFILVSGYFILAKHETFRQTLKRTINRIGIPLVFWFLVYTVWNAGNPTFEYFNLSLIYRLFTVNVFYLYFFIILIGLYLVSPLIKKYLLDSKKWSNKNLTALLLIGGSAFYFIQYFFSLCTPANSLIYWIPYTGLFVAGYTIGKSKFKNLKLLTILFMTSLSATIAGAYFYYLLTFQENYLLGDRGCLSFYTDSFLSINVVVMSLSIYAFLMHFDFNKIVKGRLKKLIYSIARASLGIYILHIFLLNILDSKLKLFDPIAPAWLYVLIKLFVIFTLAYLLSLILTKIPIIKRTLGETK